MVLNHLRTYFECHSVLINSKLKWWKHGAVAKLRATKTQYTFFLCECEKSPNPPLWKVLIKKLSSAWQTKQNIVIGTKSVSERERVKKARVPWINWENQNLLWKWPICTDSSRAIAFYRNNGEKIGCLSEWK